MFLHLSTILRHLIRYSIAKPICRNTWILRRVIAPPHTNPGEYERNPNELQDLMKYEVVDYESRHPAGPLKVILLQDVEGVGHQFDVVDVDRKLARVDLLLAKKAVYASPFDLVYYGDLRERMKEELSKRVRIPYEYVVLGRELMSSTVRVLVSIDQPWELDRELLKVSLQLAGIYVKDDMIFHSGESISGPNLALEGNLFRFYIVISKQYVVPMVGNISHVSSDENTQILQPELASSDDSDLRAYGLCKEEPYFSTAADIHMNSDVASLMRNRKDQLT